MGNVYLILGVDMEGKEAYKIGIAKDPIERLTNLKTGSSNQLSILHIYESAEYKKIEGMLHRKHKNKRSLSDNEWFYLESEDVFSFLKDCKKMEELIIFLRENNELYK